ncbi:MAG: energy-coupling factor ABC transporter ATP-binding protein [Promethearchaeota archaeon]
MIQIEDLWYTYPNGTQALKGISLEIRDSEIVTVLGENGAGKTTLMKHFNGLLKPQQGRVLIDSIDTRTMSVAQLARKVAFVFQNADYQLFSENVEKELLFTLRNLGFEENAAKERIDKTLKILNLEGYQSRSPFALSGGERKRVALASVICADPKMLILDEPTIGQDASQKRRLAQLIDQFREAGKTVFVVTHDVEFAVRNFPRAVIMAGGRIVADGPSKEVLTKPNILDISGLLPPQITELSLKINEVKKAFPKDLTTPEELASYILQNMGGKK